LERKKKTYSKLGKVLCHKHSVEREEAIHFLGWKGHKLPRKKEKDLAEESRYDTYRRGIAIV